MSPLLHQLKKRRLALGLKQNDMRLRVGISRQQYQRLESKGNPRLDTLELIARGMNSQLMLIPKEKLDAVRMILESETSGLPQSSTQQVQETLKKSLSDDPWRGLLGDEH